MDWWYSEPSMANRRQGLGKHGSKMTDNKLSQKCSQFFRGENKTFTPWKREIEILFQTVTVLPVNLGRWVPLLGHEHSFVQYVIAPEHADDFDKAYPAMKGVRMVLLDSDRKPISQAYLNPFTNDQDAKYETGRR